MEAFSVSAKNSDPIKRMRFCPARPYIEIRLPETAQSVDRLTFITVSHDQGWSDSQNRYGGTYNGSYTWFEIYAISPSNHERAPPKAVQHNVHASSVPKRHEIVWDSHDSDGDIRAWLSTVRGGDTLQLIPRAEYAAWINYVYEAEMKAEGMSVLGTESGTIVDSKDEVIGRTSTHYQPLDVFRREIRLLSISSGRFKDQIVGDLKKIYLHDDTHLEYDALSYCWGTLNVTETIKLRVPLTNSSEGLRQNDYVELDFLVTSTLYDALRYLRPETGPPLMLWVDFICINQQDLEERASQIGIMPYIYSQANQVRIWLGPSTDWSSFCFGKVKAVADRYQHECSPTHEDIPRLHEHQEFDSGFIRTWRDCDFAWFKRTWVLQEVANAKSAVVHCGWDTMPWSVILRLSDCCVKAKRHLTSSQFRHAIMPPVFSTLFEFPGDDPAATRRSADGEVLDILLAAHNLDATDPKDKIFALLQFGTDTGDVENLPPAIRPDYSKSVLDVYVDFTRWWIIEHKSLRILSAVHTTRDRGWQQMSSGDPIDLGSLDHPTWCFWYGGVASWAKATLGLASDTPYTASGDTTPDINLLTSVSSLPRGKLCLRLNGHKLCTITSIKGYPLAIDRVPDELEDAFKKIFDPVGELKTWIWIREEYPHFHRGDREYDEHFRAHVKHIPCYSSCLFLAAEGDHQKVGLCPHNARVGDIVVVLCGGRVPYLLRETAVNGTMTYQFVGECFLRGYMDGGTIQEAEATQSEKEVFDLV